MKLSVLPQMAVILVLVAAASPAAAQDGAATVAPVETMVPARVALAREYMALRDFTGGMRARIEGDLDSLADAFGGSLNVNDKPLVLSVLRSTLTTTFPELERLASEYFAALLTEEELRALIGFWSTPHGLSITRKERSGERPNGEEMRAFNAFFDTPIGNVIAEKARTMKIEDVFRAYIGLWTDAAERELCARATCRGGSVSAT